MSNKMYIIKVFVLCVATLAICEAACKSNSISEDSSSKHREMLSFVENEICRRNEEIERLRTAVEAKTTGMNQCGVQKSGLRLHCAYTGGIAKGRGNIYVACRGSSNSILVFEDSEGFNLKREIELNGILKEPYDLLFSNITNSLYVNDKGCQCIWRVSQLDADNVTAELWLAGVRRPNTFSLTNVGDILMAEQRAQLSHLLIYSLTGSLNRSMPLPGEVREPLHAVQTPDGNFIVGHKKSSHRRQYWTISKINQEGQTIQSHDPQNQSDKELYEPWYLELDSEGGRLFVSDYKNSRVVLFHTNTTTWNKVLLTWTASYISDPYGMLYDNDRKLLFVVNWKGKVSIHEVK